MRIVSGWDDELLWNVLGKDRSGRTVFLPFGPRHEGYYIDSANDEQKTKPFAMMYFVSRALVQMVGNISAFLLAEGVAFADPHTPAAHKIKVCLVIYIISISVFEFLPMWLLWKLYQKSVPEICSGMAVVGAEAIGKLEKNVAPLQRRIILAAVGFLILFSGILALLIYHR